MHNPEEIPLAASIIVRKLHDRFARLSGDAVEEYASHLINIDSRTAGELSGQHRNRSKHSAASSPLLENTNCSSSDGSVADNRTMQRRSSRLR